MDTTSKRARNPVVAVAEREAFLSRYFSERVYSPSALRRVLEERVQDNQMDLRLVYVVGRETPQAARAIAQTLKRHGTPLHERIPDHLPEQQRLEITVGLHTYQFTYSAFHNTYTIQ